RCFLAVAWLSLSDLADCISTFHPATTGNQTLSLHDALPIYFHQQHEDRAAGAEQQAGDRQQSQGDRHQLAAPAESGPAPGQPRRSEEHTSELQSRENLVCRLLLEKKKSRQDSICSLRQKTRC